MPNEDTRSVTAIEEHPKRRGRYTVALDGQDLATISAEQIAELQLRIGAIVAPRTIDALQVLDRRTAVLDRALFLLSVKARATSELKQALYRAKDRPLAADITWVIDTLTERGYLDDARFADQFVRDRTASRGWAKQRMRQELRRRGLSQADVEPALSRADDDVAIDDERSATEAARKWRRTHSAHDPDRDKQRLYGFLARRGFSPDVIRTAMRVALKDADTESR